MPAVAADFPVGTNAELRAALDPTTGAQDGDTVTFTADITLTGDLPAVQRNVTIQSASGEHFTLDGGGQFRGFLVARFNAAALEPVTVIIQDLTIQNVEARGGNGGINNNGGGAGAAAPGSAAPSSWPTWQT